MMPSWYLSNESHVFSVREGIEAVREGIEAHSSMPCSAGGFASPYLNTSVRTGVDGEEHCF